MKLKITKRGEEIAITFPDELLSQLDWQSGDVLEGEVVDGGLKIVRTETKHDRAMKIAKKGMEQYRTTLDTLAKT